MKRRFFISGILFFSARVSIAAELNAGTANMLDKSPQKIRLIPDDWNIAHVGRLGDGKTFWVTSQLDPEGGVTKDFVCTFIFNQGGELIEYFIELVGVRGSYAAGSIATATERHLTLLGDRSATDIWVRPFSVESNNSVFGLIPRQLDGGEWRVEFMPGNTLSFFAPWEAGEYDD